MWRDPARRNGRVVNQVPPLAGATHRKHAFEHAVAFDHTSQQSARDVQRDE
jgi:hypothetical protein